LEIKKQNAIFSLQNNSVDNLPFLAEKYKSDKGGLINEVKEMYRRRPHSYLEIYELMFKSLKYSTKNIFECGIGVNSTESTILEALGKDVETVIGGSLRMWKDYFPNAQIYGGDIDRSLIFQEDRISTDWLDQTSPEAIKNYFTKFDKEFDLMIDDGYHEYHAGLCLFENAIDHLAKDGIYIIEDIKFSHLKLYQEYFFNKTEYNVKYLIMGTELQSDNNLIIIKKNK
jgi:hypothetical protein